MESRPFLIPLIPLIPLVPLAPLVGGFPQRWSTAVYTLGIGSTCVDSNRFTVDSLTSGLFENFFTS